MKRYILRLVMRVAFTLTGFFVAILTADVAHDGLMPHGGFYPYQVRYFLMATLCWSIAVVLEGLTGRMRRTGSHR